MEIIMTNDFFDGYVQGKMINAARKVDKLESQLDDALTQNRAIVEKYNKLLAQYDRLEDNHDLIEADRDAAYKRIGQLGKQFGLTSDEAYDPVDVMREKILVEKRAATAARRKG